MPVKQSGAKAEGAGKGDALSARCAAIPGKMAASGIAWAQQELNAVLTAKQHKSILPGVAKRGNVMANLWFVRAAHEFAAAALARKTDDPSGESLKYAAETLLPVCKGIVQEFISDKGMNNVRMDDSGLLANTGGTTPVVGSLRLNALWYAALEMTGQALRGETAMGKAPLHAPADGRRHTGDHFERLAGRFRRAFAKVYWCEDHARICIPAAREQAEHGTALDGEQLLLTILPASPLPRTKQREILAQFETRAGDGIGVKIEHPDHGLVESPLYRAWLAVGFALDGDARKAAHIARPLMALSEAARTAGIFSFYRERSPIGRQPDVLASAEVLGALSRFSGHS
jgi:hypothetical protein